jgi:hypothetical protein
MIQYNKQNPHQCAKFHTLPQHRAALQTRKLLKRRLRVRMSEYLDEIDAVNGGIAGEFASLSQTTLSPSGHSWRRRSMPVSAAIPRQAAERAATFNTAYGLLPATAKR